MKQLVIKDKIYGTFKITEPVLIELIKSKSLQRLKGVGQFGAWDLHYSSVGYLSRYQHSIGVMLLLKKFNASLEEQIAGLLHDISHTAFSHVADYMFNSTVTQSYQDTKLDQAFEVQGINKILKKHKISPVKILQAKKFTLLETNLPDICADRIDYTLQDTMGQTISKINRKKFLEHLTVKNNKFIFMDQFWAKKFAVLYFKISQKLWCTPLQTALYQMLGDTFKLGLKKKIITKKDLFTTDKFIIKKLKKSKDKKILEKLSLIKNLKIKVVPKNQADFCTKSKARVVDPYFIKNKKLVKLSTVDAEYKQQMDAWTQRVKKGFCAKVVN